MCFHKKNDTICAIATSTGMGAIAVIRISGSKSIKISEKIFSKKLQHKKSHTIHFGTIKKQDKIIDEVLLAIFKNHQSFTGEESVEISCHGSLYIQQQILSLLLQNGCRLAQPGEFTKRAFLNGKLDLSQAEAVADLISSETQTSHEVAINQMRGDFSSELKELREKLIHFTALIELELDFSEEDVEFANRGELQELLNHLEEKITELIRSFEYGNAIKNGVPVAIVGKPNAGKSTILNGLLGEEKAIVSDIAGTTRDSIEDTLVINGITFRFIDTAGIRETTDVIEAIGVKKAKEKVKTAKIMLYVYDEQNTTSQEIIDDVKSLHHTNLITILVQNKIDKLGGFFPSSYKQEIKDALFTKYAKENIGITATEKSYIAILKSSIAANIEDFKTQGNIVISNTRHLEALKNTLQNIEQVKTGLENQISGDLLSIDIREALKNLGSITSDIDVDVDVLGKIFSSFCIGK